jgi:hypothetical protein
VSTGSSKTVPLSKNIEMHSGTYSLGFKTGINSLLFEDSIWLPEDK